MVPNPKKVHFLYIKDLQNEQDIEDLQKLLSELGLKGAVERWREVQCHLSYVSKEDDFPVEWRYSARLFRLGVLAYVYGFYEATIFYSSVAIEIGLLLGISKKKDIIIIDKGFSKKIWKFEGLIRESKILNILNDENFELADKLRKLRNFYVHLDNTLYYLRDSFKQKIKFIENYKDDRIKESEKRAVLRNARILLEEMEKTFPMIPIIRNEVLNFAREREEEFQNWIKKKGVSIPEFLKNMKQYSMIKLDAITSLE